MRKIVQIAAVPETEKSDGGVYALTNDGVVWVLADDGQDRWERIPDIPQDEPATRGNG